MDTIETSTIIISGIEIAPVVSVPTCPICGSTDLRFWETGHQWRSWDGMEDDFEDKCTCMSCGEDIVPLLPVEEPSTDDDVIPF